MHVALNVVFAKLHSGNGDVDASRRIIPKQASEGLVQGVREATQFIQPREAPATVSLCIDDDYDRHGWMDLCKPTNGRGCGTEVVDNFDIRVCHNWEVKIELGE